MIDLTDYYHKKGLMILSSKDVRILERELFDCAVKLQMIESELGMLKTSIHMLNVDEANKKYLIEEIDHVINNAAEAHADVRVSRDVFS